MAPERGSLHHLELWVDDLDAALRSWGWLLGELGWSADGAWDRGASWRLGGTYLVVEAGPDVSGRHDRLRAGLNHLSFHAGSRDAVDALVREGASCGWSLLFSDRHPYAGGPAHYAAYLEDSAGFEVELVADDA
jgi:catechol 2,3-dioxygenase-like lactoylglutathione lyase family enzyme